MPWNILEGGGAGGGGYVMPDSATYPFGSNAARNNWASNNLSDLIKNQTVVNVNGNNWFLWRGESNPDTYSASDWIEANPIVVGQTGEKGDTGDFGQLQTVDIIADDFIFTDNNANTATLTGAVTQLKGDKGDTGDQGDTGEAGLIVTAEFAGDDIVFTDNSNNQTTLANAVTTLQGERGQRGEKGEQGTPFIIQKSYASAGDMLADFGGVDVGQNEMVLILTGQGNPDNGDVYTKGATQWQYVTTLDGAAGIQGVAGADGVDGQDGADGEDGAAVNSATVNVDGDLEIGLDSGVNINAGRVTGLSAYEVWIAEGNTGTEADYIEYLRRRLTFNNTDLDGIELATDSGLSGLVANDLLRLDAPILGDALTDSNELPPVMPTDPTVKIRAFKYHPDMPEMILVETGAATKVINTLPHGSSYILKPTSHGNGAMTGSAYTVSQAAGSAPNDGKYESIPLFVFQPDSAIGFRDRYGFVSYPSDLALDFSAGFYLTTLITGHYAGGTGSESFVFVGNALGDSAGNGGVGVFFAPAGCFIAHGGGSTILEPSFTFNANNGQPVFYRVAIYQTAAADLHVSVRRCDTGEVATGTVSSTLLTSTVHKVYLGMDRSGSSPTIAFGETTLWIPDHDDDITKINFRG